MKVRTTTPTDENVATVVRMLLAAKRGTHDDVAKALGMHRASLFERLNGNREWKANEVFKLAQFFGLPVTTFYEGFAALAISDGYQPGFFDVEAPESYQMPLLDNLAVTAA